MLVNKQTLVRLYKPAIAKWKQQTYDSNTGWCNSKRLEAEKDRFGLKVWSSPSNHGCKTAVASCLIGLNSQSLQRWAWCKEHDVKGKDIFERETSFEWQASVPSILVGILVLLPSFRFVALKELLSCSCNCLSKMIRSYLLITFVTFNWGCSMSQSNVGRSRAFSSHSSHSSALLFLLFASWACVED